MVPRTVLLAALPVLAVPEPSPGAASQGNSFSPASPTVLVLPQENTGRDANLNCLGEGLAELTLERLSEEGHVVFLREGTRQLLSVLDGTVENGERP